MQPRNRVGPARTIHLREVPDRPAGPNQRLPGEQRGDASLLERARDMCLQLPELTRRWRVVSQEMVDEAQGPQRQRPRARLFTCPEACDLDAAPANVQHDAIVDRESVHGAEERV